MSEEEKAAAEKAAKEAAEKEAAKKLEALQKQLDESNKRAEEEAKTRQALQDQLKKIELEKMDEHDRKVAEAAQKEAEKHAPVHERVSKLEASLREMLDSELAEIPEEKRALFPLVGTVEEQLTALRKAKKGGLFGPVRQASSSNILPGDSPPNNDEDKGANTELAKEDPAKFFDKLSAELGIKFKQR